MELGSNKNNKWQSKFDVGDNDDGDVDADQEEHFCQAGFQRVLSSAGAQFASLASILPDSKKGYISPSSFSLLHKQSPR